MIINIDKMLTDTALLRLWEGCAVVSDDIQVNEGGQLSGLL